MKTVYVFEDSLKVMVKCLRVLNIRVDIFTKSKKQHKNLKIDINT